MYKKIKLASSFVPFNCLMNAVLPRTMLTVVETVKNDNVYCRFIQFTVVKSSIRPFPIVNNAVRYGRNTAHTKRVKYDEKRPFTTGLVSPG